MKYAMHFPTGTLRRSTPFTSSMQRMNILHTFGCSKIPSDLESLNKTCFEAIKQACDNEEWSKVRSVKGSVAGLKSPRGRNLFFEYIHEGNEKQVQAIIRENLVDVLSDGKSAFSLHQAVKSGQGKLLQTLMQNGYGTLTTENEKGQIPLHLALKSGRIKLIKHLLPKPNSFDYLYRPKKRNETCLHLVIRKGQIKTLKRLTKKYSRQTDHLFLQQDKEGKTIFKHALDKADCVILDLLKLKAEDQNISGDEIDTIAAFLEEQATKKFTVKFSRPNFIKSPPLNLVFQGGGPKGIIYIGALKALAEQVRTDGIFLLDGIKCCAGTSAGAIQACSIAVGCSYQDLQNLADKYPLKEMLDDSRLFERLESFRGDISRLLSSQIKDISDLSFKSLSAIPWFDLMTVLNIKAKLETQNGLFGYEKFQEVIEEQIFEKTGIRHLTFGELAELVRKGSKKSPGRYPFKHLHVFATNIGNIQKPEVVDINSEDPKWREVVVARAVVCSMAIPLFFKTPVLQFKDDFGNLSEEKVELVDGGIVYNYPIDFYDIAKGTYDGLPEESQNDPLFNPRTLGLSLFSQDKEETDEDNKHSFLDVLLAGGNLIRRVDDTVLKRIKRNFDRTIFLKHMGISLFDFNTKSKEGKGKEGIDTAYHDVCAFFKEQERRLESDSKVNYYKQTLKGKKVKGKEEGTSEEEEEPDHVSTPKKGGEDILSTWSLLPDLELVGQVYGEVLGGILKPIKLSIQGGLAIIKTLNNVTEHPFHVAVLKAGYETYRSNEFTKLKNDPKASFGLFQAIGKETANTIYKKHHSFFSDPEFAKKYMPAIAFQNNQKVLTFLSSQRIDMNVESLTGPLILEVLFYRLYHAFRALLLSDDYDQKDKERRLRDARGNTILHHIVEAGLVKAYRILVKLHKLVPLLNIKNALGKTAILVAAERKKSDFVLELACKAETDLTVTQPESGKTLLHLLAANGNVKVFNTFVEIAQKKGVLEKIIELENRNGLGIEDSKMAHGQSDSILFATDDFAILRKMIDLGIRLDVKQSSDNRTFPYICVKKHDAEILMHYCEKLDPSVCKKIINCKVDSSTKIQKTPLILALEKNYLTSVLYLIRKWANCTDPVGGRTPLECATSDKGRKIIRNQNSGLNDLMK